MTKKCSYFYKGKTYSQDRLYRELVKELPSRSQQESIDFLKDYLGMDEHEIQIVKGLIDGKSLGRFKADGNILLSDLAGIDVAYHEAFHRVWRLYLDPSERLDAIKEIKRRKNIQSLIDSYRIAYPKLSENDLIEEILADEFYDYRLNSNFKTSLPLKTWFQRVLNFLKKLIGLKPSQIQMIYDKILVKAYKGKVKSVQQYLKDADKVLIGDHQFSIDEKNEIVKILTQRFIKGMLEINGDINAFINGGSVKIKDFLDQVIMPSIGNDLLDVNEDENGIIVDAIYADVDPVIRDKTKDLDSSILLSEMIQNLRLVGLTIKDNSKEDDTEGALDDDTKAPREFTPSIEIDPKSKIGSKVKLLLSSLVDVSERTPVFGLSRPLSWEEAFVQLGIRMMGVPTSAFREELKLLNLSYVPDLVNFLEKDPIFANEFITSMAMTENKFYKIQLKDGEIYFFDANSGTRRDKVLNEWRNGLVKAIENWEDWKTKTKTLNSKRTLITNEDIIEHFGFELNDQIPNVRTDLLTILDQASKYEGDKPESKNMFRDLGIDGYTKTLAEKQAQFEDQVDLMVTMGGNKLYMLGLNTQQTRVINGVTYAQSKFIPRPTETELAELSPEEAINQVKLVDAQNIDIIREYAPMVVSEFNVSKQEDGTYLIRNKWLDKILAGERIELVIPYMMDTQVGDELEISKLNESDLFAMHLNGTLQGTNISMKHADRGTFFAYRFGNNNPLLTKEESPGKILGVLENIISEQIQLERKFANKMKDLKLPIQHIGKEAPGAFFTDIIGDGWEQFLKTGELDKIKVKKFVAEKFKEYKDDVESFGLLESYNAPIYSDKGKKEKSISKLKGISQQLRLEYGNLELLLASAFANETASHIYETRFFSGDVRAFKNGTDLFKRLSPQSSNGKVSVVDNITNQEVLRQLDQEFEILNPVTGEFEKVNPATKIGNGKEKYFRAVTGAEREVYKSHLLRPAISTSGKPIISKLTGKNESKLFMLFEYEFIQDFPDKTLDELKKLYLTKFELYEKKYKEINENDGLSYMSLPAFKNFMIRQGLWSKGMEVVYQAEMKIAGLSDPREIANIEVTVDGVTFKPFEVRASKYTNKNGTIRSLDGWHKRAVDGKIISLDSVHTLKTQFGGYSTPEEYYDDTKGQMEYVFNSVFKTSQHLLIPSSIMGTNLQLMNFSMLKNGVDIYHMGSANKVGGVDPKLAAKNVLDNPDDVRNTRATIQDVADRGLDFYDKNGYFNHVALDENIDILSYLSDWDDLKDQVKIGNKVKEKIKGSTQSLKILVSNLIINSEERFQGARQIVDSYKEIVKEMVKTNHDNLLAKIGYNIDTAEFDTLDKLKKVILESSQMETAADNIRNSVENFFSDISIGLEPIPMKNKIENVLYALITSGIISFDRPGSSYPQAAVTGYETLGSRTFDENGIQESNQDTLKFYDPEFDDEGNITKVNPAEIIIPLPDKWIKPLLKWAKTTNLVTAIEKLNKHIVERPELFQVKGLRIPNQQLSSNDIVQIKKFHLPTMQNYVLVPSEIVVKVGSDFDIDSLKIYWGNLSKQVFGEVSNEELFDLYAQYLEQNEEENPLTIEEFKGVYNSTLDQTLLDYEKQILLHPRNVHHLLMPLTDEIFVKDIYDYLVDQELITPPPKSSVASILPSTNVKNAIVFVKGKDGVGPVALGITNSATNQADTLSISQVFKNQDGVQRPTGLLFQHMKDVYAMDNYTDNKGTVISEILSQLLTTQVDNVKNPTAVLMNINMQTLGVVLYLIRRKINPKSIILFLQQPIIAKYLQYQRQNESLINKQVTMFDKQAGEQGKGSLITKLLNDLGYKEKLPDDVYETDFEITDNNMLASAKSGKFDKQQLSYLRYFQDLVEQSRAFSDFQQTQNSDTKGLKDRQAWDEAQEIINRVSLSGIVSDLDVIRINSYGVISPFYQYGRRTYDIYREFYSLVNSRFGKKLLDFKNAAAEFEKGVNKDRVRQTIENDFMLFLVHTFGTNKDEFDRLMKGNSVAKRIIELKKNLPQNLVLKSFFPVLANSTDISKPESPQKIDNLRLFEKELSSLTSNDLQASMEEIYERDAELYNDLVKLLFFQSGLNVSPFNYRSVVPVGLNSKRNAFNEFQYLYQDLLLNSLKELNSFNLTDDQATKIFNRFVGLFAANNTNFLRTNNPGLWKGNYPYPIAKIRDRETNSIKLTTKDNKQEQPQLGNAYMKQYFKELLNENLYSDKQQEKKVPKEEPVEFTPYEEVVDQKPLGLSSGNTKIKIISGGQFGGDLGGLLAARELGLETGGTAPKGFKVDYTDKRSVKGSNPDLMSFGLLEDSSSDYPSRTMKNVDDSDGTIAFMWGSSVGTSKTIGYAQTGKWVHKIDNFTGKPIKPNLVITTKDEFEASVQIKNFVQKYNINVLNIAGHRETSQPGIEEFVKNSLVQGLKEISVNSRDSGIQGVLFELDNAQSQYSPSLKMYEGFIQMNQLYTGDEILPFIGESEYYRYLVPMLLKMNPGISTVFTDDMSFVAESLLTAKDIDQLREEGRRINGISSPILNRNFINNSTRTKTVVHELVHRTLQKEYEKGEEFKRKIDELYSHTSDFDSVDAYGFTNPKEFLAEALANPDFMAILNTIQYKEETVWTYLMTLISDFINNLLNIELRSDSVLAEVVRVSEQVLQNNLNEVGKEKIVKLSELGNEIVDNWNTYFPQYSWMNDAQKQMTAKLVEEGKITLNCSF